jgi:hypothetical protein
MEQQTLNAHAEPTGNYGFVIGLLTGAVVGTGLAMWLAPKSAGEIRDRVTSSARRLRDDLRDRRDGVRDGVADAVVRGAHEVERGAQEVERFAVAAKSDHRTV